MKRAKAPKLVTVAIFTTVTIVFWVFYTLYNILVGEPSLNIDPVLLEPINPNLNIDALDKIEKRLFYTQEEVTSPYLISPEFIPIIIIFPEESTDSAEIETESSLETPPTATSESLLE